MTPATDSGPMQELLAELRKLVGSDAVLQGAHDMEPYVTDWRKRFRGDACCVVKPANREQVAAVVRACAARGVTMLPQGGNTSLSGGSVPFEATQAPPPVIMNLGRMHAIRKVDPLNNSLEAEAGCTVAEIQAAAAAVGRLYPVSFGAEGSAQIGGAVATNAGGTAVLRYGNTRENVLGLEAVLPDGSVLDCMRTLRKDNTGYDLKQLFIGSEGTLGIVTAVAVKLHPLPTVRAVAWVAPGSIAAALELLALMQGRAGDCLSAFEIMNCVQVEHVFAHVTAVRNPLPDLAQWNLLVELSGQGDAMAMRDMLEEVLADAHESGLISNAAVASNESQCGDFWRIRHSVSEGNTKSGMSVVFDVAVPLSSVADFVERATTEVRRRADWARIAVVSHLGDGNVHFVPVFERQRWDALPEQAAFLEGLREAVYELVAELKGTWSAEHGIGRTLLKQMGRYKSPAELAVMRAVKATLDPLGLFNPGKLLP